METFLKTIAWVGLGLFTLLVVPSFFIWLSWIYNPQDLSGWQIIALVQFLSLLSMLIGGLVGRPRYYWHVTAWVGLGWFVIGTGLAFYIWMALINWHPGPYLTMGPELGWVILYPLLYLGLLLMYIVGLITRPRYYWLACILTGLLYISVSLPPEWDFITRSIKEEGLSGIKYSNASVGLLPILLGILLLMIDKLLRGKNLGGFLPPSISNR
jgi:hypothetical protein